MSSNHNSMARSGGKKESIIIDSSAVDTKGARTRKQSGAHDKTTISLIIALVAIVVVIISLAGIAIFNAINQNNQNQTQVPYETDDKAIKTAEEFSPGITDISRIKEEAEKIYNNDPNNTEKVVSYYLGVYNQKVSENNTYFANTLIYSEQNFFINHNSEEGELAALTSFDYTGMDGAFSYQFLKRILELADKLNKPEIRQKFEPLATEAKAADDERYRRIQENADKINAEIEQAEETKQAEDAERATEGDTENNTSEEVKE